MEIKVLEDEEGKLRLEVIGEDHTLLNALRKELWNDKDTEIAGYKIDHILVGNPVLIVVGTGINEILPIAAYV